MAGLTAEEVVSGLKIEKGRAVVGNGWGLSAGTMPPDGPDFLKEDVLRGICRDLTLNAAATGALTGIARRVREDELLRALAWHLHHCVYLNPDFRSDYDTEWPDLDGALGEDAERFYALVIVSNQPRLKVLYRERGIPDDVAGDTLESVIWTLNREKKPGRFHRSETHWRSFFLRGDIFRLGRLQFQYGLFDLGVRVFRHRTNGTVLALSEDGLRYRADGGAAEYDWTDEPDNWTSKLVETDREIVGNPIHPDGRALQKEVRLPKSDWAQVLGGGEPMLAIHIPGEGKLEHEKCGESFRRALEFFPRHFPDRPFQGFDCHCWIFDRQMRDFVPSSSNMLRMQREVYICPAAMGAGNLPHHILDGVPEDLSKVPRNTGFQRALVDFLAGGGKLRPIGGSWFLLKEDVDWGGEVYLRQDAV